jgi:hypothetical protein
MEEEVRKVVGLALMSDFRLVLFLTEKLAFRDKSRFAFDSLMTSSAGTEEIRSISLLRFLAGGVGAKRLDNLLLLLNCAGIDATRTISLLRFLVGGVGAKQHAYFEWVGVKVEFMFFALIDCSRMCA